jgi:phage terminase small subunit
MPRHKKPVELKKLQGTYREGRDDGVETHISGYLEVPNNIEAPLDITDELCREHYKHHVRLLVNLKILTLSDLPEIAMMYHALQEYRKIHAAMVRVDMVADAETYDFLSERMLKFGRMFSSLATKYCISPVARNKLTMESLNIQKEIKQQSVMAKLIGKKRA